jgi:prepilin-type N-terminal cleavage/methylation domain-containing protein/prepilin-type processing-associated H-X9-DG protein
MYTKATLTDNSQNRPGFTLVELCVAMGVIAVLLALSIPAILHSREASRQLQCKDRLRQLSLGCLGFEAANRHLPHSYKPRPMVFALLPFLEQQSLYHDLTNFPTYRGANETSAKYSPPSVYVCPSDSENFRVGPGSQGKLWGMNYVANAGTGFTRAGYDGLFGVEMERLSLREITDGLSNTSLFSECLVTAGDWSVRHGLIYNLHAPIFEPERFSELMDAIASAHLSGAFSTPNSSRGRPWTDINDHYRVFHHALGPNSNSGFNFQSVQGGLYSTASNHPGSVNLVFVDGSATNISNEISPDVWWAMGSRSGREVVAN